MGIQFTLSDRELPASPVFVRFLAAMLFGETRAPEDWADQTSEHLSQSRPEDSRIAIEAGQRVMADPRGRELVARAYGYLAALLIGDLDPVEEFRSRFRILAVVGIPRTGGSYLTSELFRALGMQPSEVPHALAHDSFPEVEPFAIGNDGNSWVRALKTAAEYMVMTELYFGDRPQHAGQITVPKKFTQAVYAAGLFRQLMGPGARTLLTVRHPVAAAVSTYEKSGGLPPGGRFAVRSNIEAWCRRDLAMAGCDEGVIAEMDYFEAYLRYWESYHLAVAVNGLAGCPDPTVVAFGKEALQSLAQSLHVDLGSVLTPREFRASSQACQRHPDWVTRAQPSLERVAATWRLVGLAFPVAKLAKCA